MPFSLRQRPIGGGGNSISAAVVPAAVLRASARKCQQCEKLAQVQFAEKDGSKPDVSSFVEAIFH